MKILKCITVAVLLIALGVSSLQGSDTRVTSMGYLANLYLRDNYNIWYFPSTITNYRNLIIIDSNNGYFSGSDQLFGSPVYGNKMWRGGIHLPLSSAFTMGVYLSNDTRDLLIEDTSLDQASHQFTLFGGYSMDNVDLGIYASSYSTKETFTDPDTPDNNTEENLTRREYGVGVSFKGNERTRVDGTIFYRTGDFASILAGRTATQLMAPESYNSYGILVRVFYAYSAKVIIVPFAGYGVEKAGYRSLVPDAFTLTQVYKSTMYLIGCGVDLIPFERALISLAAGYQKMSMTSDVTLSSGTPDPSNEYGGHVLPFLSVGLEARLTKWLGARFSFYELLGTEITKSLSTVGDNLTERKETGSSYSARFGLWFRWARFTIDVLVDTESLSDFLHNGPYILSGNQHEQGLFPKLSITYNFNSNDQ